MTCSHKTSKLIAPAEDLDDNEVRQCIKCGCTFARSPNLQEGDVRSGSGKKSTAGRIRSKFSTRYGRKRTY